jgi:hypothetical protein
MADIQENWEETREQLEQEIKEFNQEKERIKRLIGDIGGKRYSKRDNAVNLVFLLLILTLFILEITTHWLPAFISLEVSVLLVSIKIVWMIHSQHKYNHFIFWILNTIEFRINDTSKHIKKVEKMVEQINADSGTE